MNNMQTALVGLDWGTSSLRAFRMSASGDVLEQRSSKHGIQHLPEAGNAGFELAFEEICGDWLEQCDVPVIAGGMVGSAQGWKEAPYLPCPATLAELGKAASTVITERGRKVLIAPGLIFEPAIGAPDVMRGEEIQIAGAIAEREEWAKHALLVMPGTHSKWVELRDGKIPSFATYMTGELYAVMVQNSILGRLMPSSGNVDVTVAADAFARGVTMASQCMPGDLSHQMFSVRTLGLTGKIAAEALGDYLSGLLIGHELVSGLSRAKTLGKDIPLIIIGEGALCDRYARALSQMSATPAGHIENPAAQGLYWLAKTTGLITTERSI